MYRKVPTRSPVIVNELFSLSSGLQIADVDRDDRPDVVISGGAGVEIYYQTDVGLLVATQTQQLFNDTARVGAAGNLDDDDLPDCD